MLLHNAQHPLGQSKTESFVLHWLRTHATYLAEYLTSLQAFCRYVYCMGEWLKNIL